MAVDYSVIIPAYNEASWLPATLSALQRAMSALEADGELIVVDNNSDDGTGVLAAEAGARVVFEPVNQISRARNAGAAVAHGRYLIFVDADTLIEPALLAQAVANMAGGNCAGGGALVRFDVPLHAATRVGLHLWNRLSQARRVAAGCFVYALREAYDDVGGFSEAVYASEEIWFSRRVRRWGRGRRLEFCIIREPYAVSSGRKLAWFGMWQQLGLMLMALLFPFFVRFKRLCGFWYSRPEVKN